METTFASMEVDCYKVQLELQWTKMATAQSKNRKAVVTKSMLFQFNVGHKLLL